MPNIKSAKKRVKVTRNKSVNNNDYKSSMKTSIKKFEKALHEGKKELIETCFNDANKKIDNACKKGVIKKNTAARYKSNLAKKLSKNSSK